MKMKFPLWGASQWAPCLTLLSVVVVVLESSFVEPPEPVFSLRSLAEDETRLPCHYQVEANNTVVQVTWHKELADGTKEQIITAHFSEGHTEFGRYSGRVRFESASPTEYSALLIPNTEESDEGSYTCQITTFPLGNFERRIMLTVWSKHPLLTRPLLFPGSPATASLAQSDCRLRQSVKISITLSLYIAANKEWVDTLSLPTSLQLLDG